MDGKVIRELGRGMVQEVLLIKIDTAMANSLLNKHRLSWTK